MANAKALAGALVERGFDLVSGGTDNHLILVDLTLEGRPGQDRRQGARPGAASTLNYNTVPFDPRKPFDPVGHPPRYAGRHHPRHEGARDGAIARWIDEGVEAAKREDEEALERIAGEVPELALQFPIPGL